MKKTGKLIAGVVVLVALSGSYVLLKDHNEKVEEQEQTQEEEETVQVLSMDSEDLKEIQFALDDGEVTFARNEEQWINQEDPDFPLDGDKVDTLISKIEDLEADRLLEDVENLEEYGLDDPQKTIRIVDNQDEEQVLYVGNKNETTNQYYVKRKDEDSKVYVIASSNITPFDGKLYDFAKAGSFPTITSTDVNRIQLEREEDSYVLVASADTSSGWLVGETEKNLEDGDSADAYTMMSAVGTLSYDDFVDYNCSDLSEYGLEKPYAVLTVDYQETVEAATEESEESTETAEEAKEDDTTDTEETSEESAEDTEEETKEQIVDRQLVLKIGDLCSDGRYVNLDGTKEVYTMSEDTLSQILDKKVSDFWNLTVNYVPVTDMEEFTVEADGESVTIHPEEEIVEPEESEEEEGTETAEDASSDEEEAPETETVYYNQEQKVDALEFKTFYSAAVNISAQQRLEEEYKPEGDADLRFTIKKTDGTISEVAYYVYDNNFYIGIRDDKKQYLVNKMEIKQLQESWKEFLTKEEAEEESES